MAVDKLPHGSRVWLAWTRCEEVLADGEWHYTSMVVEAMMQAGGIVKKTAANLLTEGVGYGVIERKGYKRGLWNGGYTDQRMVRSIPAKQDRFDRERAGYVADSGDQDLSPSPRRGEADREPRSPGIDEDASRADRLAGIRVEMRQSHPPTPNVDVAVNPPGKEFTLEEWQTVQRQAKARAREARRKGRHRPTEPPSGY